MLRDRFHGSRVVPDPEPVPEPTGARWFHGSTPLVGTGTAPGNRRQSAIGVEHGDHAYPRLSLGWFVAMAVAAPADIPLSHATLPASDDLMLRLLNWLPAELTLDPVVERRCWSIEGHPRTGANQPGTGAAVVADVMPDASATNRVRPAAPARAGHALLPAAHEVVIVSRSARGRCDLRQPRPPSTHRSPISRPETEGVTA